MKKFYKVAGGYICWYTEVGPVTVGGGYDMHDVRLVVGGTSYSFDPVDKVIYVARCNSRVTGNEIYYVPPPINGLDEFRCALIKNGINLRFKPNAKEGKLRIMDAIAYFVDETLGDRNV